MAMRSAMNGTRTRRGHARRRGQHQRHREYRAMAGTGARGADVTAHAARQLSCDGQPQSGTMGHALAAAAVVEVEKLFGALGCETASVVANVEAPASIGDTCRQLDDATTVFVRVVEQVLEDHAQAVAIGEHLGRIHACELHLAAAAGARAVRQQLVEEARHLEWLQTLAWLARHGALIGEDGLREVLEAVALQLPELDELGTLCFGNAAHPETLQ